MSEEKSVHVMIDGQLIEVSGEDVATMQQIADYINRKIRELKETGSYNRQSGVDKHRLLLLNVANDYFREKQRVRELEAQLSDMEDVMEQLRRELVRERMRQEKQEL